LGLAAVLNPLRSEQEALRFLLYVAAVVGVIVAIAESSTPRRDGDLWWL
jgi:hypothetical protein